MNNHVREQQIQQYGPELRKKMQITDGHWEFTSMAEYDPAQRLTALEEELVSDREAAAEALRNGLAETSDWTAENLAADTDVRREDETFSVINCLFRRLPETWATYQNSVMRLEMVDAIDEDAFAEAVDRGEDYMQEGKTVYFGLFVDPDDFTSQETPLDTVDNILHDDREKDREEEYDLSFIPADDASVRIVVGDEATYRDEVRALGEAYAETMIDELERVQEEHGNADQSRGGDPPDDIMVR